MGVIRIVHISERGRAPGSPSRIQPTCTLGWLRVFLSVVFPIESQVSAPGACRSDEANVIVSLAQAAYALIVLGRRRGDWPRQAMTFSGVMYLDRAVPLAWSKYSAK